MSADDIDVLLTRRALYDTVQRAVRQRKRRCSMEGGRQSSLVDMYGVPSDDSSATLTLPEALKDAAKGSVAK